MFLFIYYIEWEGPGLCVNVKERGFLRVKRLSTTALKSDMCLGLVLEGRKDEGEHG